MHEARATVKFDLSGLNIPADKTINSAKLAIYRTHEPKLNLSYGYDQDGQILCNSSNVDWSTSTDGFRTLFPKIVDAHDTRSGDTLNYVKNTIDWLEFDVTDIVSGMMADPSSNNGFIFRGFIPGSAPTSWGTVGNTSVFDEPGHSGINGGYASSEHSDASLRPKLIISYGDDTDLKNNISNSKRDVSIFIYKNELKIMNLFDNNIDIALLTFNGRLLSSKNIEVAKASISLEIPDFAKNAIVLQIRSKNLNIIKKIIR